MNKIENELVEKISESIKKLYSIHEDKLVMIEIPKQHVNGDYSTNVALRLSKQLKKAPAEIAKEIVTSLNGQSPIEKMEVAGPGFINFWINKTAIANVINEIVEKQDDYGRNCVQSLEKVLLEYISANPTGPLHLGHARGAAWGDSLQRIMNFSGISCTSEYYLNDLGAQIDNLGKSVYARYCEHFNVMVDMPEDGYYGQEVKDIGAKFAQAYSDRYVGSKDAIDFFKEAGKEEMLEKIKEHLELFRVHFDSWISEAELYKSGKVDAALNQMIQKGLTYEKEGALWLKTTDFGDDKDRVLRKSNGLLTYFTPDIANHVYKLERGYTHLINLWGGDHYGYIPRMKAALTALGYDKDVLTVDTIQMVRLVDEGVEVKMSKRTGNAVTLKELCEMTSVDAVRYFFVSRALDTQLDFDLKIATQKSAENPVYYAQYAHARMCSVLKQTSVDKKITVFDLLTHEKEIDLLKCIADFSSVVADCAITRSPNKLCNYIQKLASYFHGFYTVCKVIDTENPDLSLQRYYLVLASKITLKNALSLIGVEAVEKM